MIPSVSQPRQSPVPKLTTYSKGSHTEGARTESCSWPSPSLGSPFRAPPSLGLCTFLAILELQSAPGLLLHLAETQKGPCCLPEGPGSFPSICQSLQWALLPSRLPQVLCQAFPKPTRGPAASWLSQGFCCSLPKLRRGSPAFQMAAWLLLGFTKAHMGPCCLPDGPRAFTRLF